MFKISVPATSANLGSGFDVLGMALSVFNEYSFSPCRDFELEGFAPEYLDLSKNLVLSSYRRTFDILNKEAAPVKITEISRGIPRSGGLGSSAACIVAGVLGAVSVMGAGLKGEEILNIASAIEGHPDNVAPALFGGLTACVKTDSGFRAERYEPSRKLNFTVCYPDFSVSTEEARAVLPRTLPLRDAVENLSRIVNLPRAFESGDLELIRECVKDNIHEPHRIKLIEDGALIKECAERCGGAAVISGSGAAMLVVSRGAEILNELGKLKTKRKWEYMTVSPVSEGAVKYIQGVEKRLCMKII